MWFLSSTVLFLFWSVDGEYGRDDRQHANNYCKRNILREPITLFLRQGGRLATQLSRLATALLHSLRLAIRVCGVHLTLLHARAMASNLLCVVFRHLTVFG